MQYSAYFSFRHTRMPCGRKSPLTGSEAPRGNPSGDPAWAPEGSNPGWPGSPVATGALEGHRSSVSPSPLPVRRPRGARLPKLTAFTASGANQGRREWEPSCRRVANFGSGCAKKDRTPPPGSDETHWSIGFPACPFLDVLFVSLSVRGTASLHPIPSVFKPMGSDLACGGRLGQRLLQGEAVNGPETPGQVQAVNAHHGTLRE